MTTYETEPRFLRDLIDRAIFHSESVHSAERELYRLTGIEQPAPDLSGDYSELEMAFVDLAEAAATLGVKLGPILAQRARALAEGCGGYDNGDFRQRLALNERANAYFRPIFEASGIPDDFRAGSEPKR